MIKRIAILALLLVALFLVMTASPVNGQSVPASGAADGSGGQDGQSVAALATNTKRPTAVPTNTRRPSSTPDFTATPSDTPTRTLTPTRTPIPPTETPTITPTTIGPVSYPEGINALTGLPFPDEASKARRNLIVKVSNYPWVVRPQTGLDKADIVWEYEVEGGVTRFAAIYRSQGSEHVGSVRSGRLLDLELVVMYQALFAYSGVNDQIKKLIGEADWKYQTQSPQFGDNCPPFCRFPKPGLPFEHTLFGNTYQMWDLATRRNVNTGMQVRGFAFDETPDPNGRAILDINIEWYGDQDMRWQYNPSDGKYYRWNTGTPHVDALTGKQLTADNVIILQAYHVDRPDIYESESGAVTQEIQLWGREKVYVCREGQCYEGIWIHRQGRSGLGLYYPDGQTPIHLKPGQSWVQVVRCCNMYGVTLNPTYVDAAGTSTPAFLTVTARAPKLPADLQTKQAPAAGMTLTSSAATAQFGQAPANPTAGPSPTPTGTPISVGMRP